VWDSVWDSVGDSVWDSVGDSVWASVGDSVWDSVGDSVGAYIYSLFAPDAPNEHHAGMLACASLWRKGLVPSCDGETWRLHAGEDAAVVWEGTL
ncbi:MAG: hypothetical protein WC565_08975, partial [Parcubacteria group bacterium]